MGELQEAFESQEHIFMGSRHMHRAWMMSMHYHTLLTYVRRGLLYKAELTDQWKTVYLNAGQNIINGQIVNIPIAGKYSV
jgi:hypothetical protein